VTYKRKSVKIRVALQRIQRHPHAKTKYRVSTNNQLTQKPLISKNNTLPLDPDLQEMTLLIEDQKNSKTKI